jgi:polar amino acid transport system substrate-binding protein
MRKYGCLAAILILALGWMLTGCSKQEAPPMAKLEDLAHKRIGIYSGTMYDKFVVDTFPEATPMRYKDQADLILAIKGEKIDAAILNYAAAKIMLKTNIEVGILTDQVLSLPIGVGFNKNNPALREQFNSFLRASKADGSMDAMYKKWFETDLDTVKMPRFADTPNRRTIKVGVAVGDLPSSGLIDGEYVGFDVEMLQTFAQKAGLKLEFTSLEFGALIASLASGKVDMIADCIAITPERQKQIDFSDPYMEDKTAAIALKRNIAHLQKSALAEAGKQSFWESVVQSFYSNILQENRYLLILDGLQVTLIISVFSLLCGTLLGAFICYLRMSSRKVVREGAKVYISLMRGVPVLVLLMLTYYVIFAKTNISPVLVAVIAFSLNFAAYVAEMYRSAIESVDKGQTEAGIAGGFTPAQTFYYIVMPQALIRVLPVYKGELISLVKMTSIVGYVAVQDLTKASDIIRSRTFDAFFPLIMSAVLYFVISWGLLQVLEVFEKRTDPKQRRAKNSLRWPTALNGRQKP